jgi:DNA (cytosine-5)-methyltransferase 1
MTNVKKNDSKSQDQYTVGSLFAGVGGICKGFQQAGAKILWANEFDKSACSTYRANFDHRLYEQDIHEVDADEVDKVDIITSGFPCQAFSIAGYQKGFRDKRGDLFFETMRFINEIRPKAFLLENVKNLASHDRGNTLKVIKDYILHSNYSFISKVMNTMEYGNIPQNRERIYIVGFRDEACFNDFEMHPEAICSRAFSFPERIELTVKLNDILMKERADKYYYYDRFPIYKFLATEVERRDTVYQWRRVYVRENKSNVCPTLTANMGTGGHDLPHLVVPA